MLKPAETACRPPNPTARSASSSSSSIDDGKAYARAEIELRQGDRRGQGQGDYDLPAMLFGVAALLALAGAVTALALGIVLRARDADRPAGGRHCWLADLRRASPAARWPGYGVAATWKRR